MGPNNPNKGLLVPLRPMKKIMQSPYESSDGAKSIRSAEVDERLFDETKALFQSVGLGRVKHPSPAAVKFFGSDLAKKVVETSDRIAMSGMMYSNEWSTGMIHDKNVGKIPKDLLLLCLLEQRLARNAALSLIVKDLDLCRDLMRALRKWKLTKKYPKVANCKSASMFSTQQNACLKCIIFIARAWNCFRLLKQDKVDPSLLSKVCDCLYILDTNAKVPMPRVKPRTSVQAFSLPTMTTPPPVNRTSATGASSGTSGISHQLFASKPSAVERRPSPPSQAKSPGKVFPAETPGGQSTYGGDTTTTPLRPAVSTLHETATNAESPWRDNPAYQQWLKDEESGESTVNYWYPIEEEMILNPTEIEMAWLLEETLYCTRKKEVNWVFIFKFASPTLREQLLKLPSPDDDAAEGDDRDESDKKRLGSVVRMSFGMVEKRFAEVRRDIRKRLILRETRPAMRKIVPSLRRATHPLNVKRRRMASSQRGRK